MLLRRYHKPKKPVVSEPVEEEKKISEPVEEEKKPARRGRRKKGETV